MVEHQAQHGKQHHIVLVRIGGRHHFALCGRKGTMDRGEVPLGHAERDFKERVTQPRRRVLVDLRYQLEHVGIGQQIADTR